MKIVTTYLPALVHRIEQLTKAFALFGGLILMLLAGLTIVSVIGRTINAYGFGPIQGDFELVENGTAFVVFCSLPYCQMRFGHVSVDIISRQFPRMLSWLIAMISHLGMSVIAFILTRQLYLGMRDKYLWGETTFILQLPAYWGYAAALPASFLWLVACLAATASIFLNRTSHRRLADDVF